MNSLQQIYLQAIIKQQELENVKQEEEVQRQNQENLRQRQLLSFVVLFSLQKNSIFQDQLKNYLLAIANFSEFAIKEFTY